MPAPVYVDTTTIQLPAVTTPRTPVSAAWGLGVRDDLEWLAKPPRARVSRSTSQSIPHNSSTAIAFDVEEYDYAAGNFGGIAGGAIWSAATPTRLIAPFTGTYITQGSGQFAANATGARIITLSVNGTTNISVSNGGGAAAWYVGSPISADIRLAAGDYVEMYAYQTCGGALNFDAAYPIWASLRLVAVG